MASLAVAIRLCSYSHTPSCSELWKKPGLWIIWTHQGLHHYSAGWAQTQNLTQSHSQFMEFTRVLILSSEMFEWIVTTTTQMTFISQNMTVQSHEYCHHFQSAPRHTMSLSPSVSHLQGTKGRTKRVHVSPRPYYLKELFYSATACVTMQSHGLGWVKPLFSPPAANPGVHCQFKWKNCKETPWSNSESMAVIIETAQSSSTPLNFTISKVYFISQVIHLSLLIIPTISAVFTIVL